MGSIALCYISLYLKHVDHHRNPNKINKDHLIESFFSTLENKLPRFHITLQLMLYSALGCYFDLTTSKVLRFRNRAKEVVKEDLETGGQMDQALNTLGTSKKTCKISDIVQKGGEGSEKFRM